MKVTTSQILPRERVIALGTFDGVHLGHQAVLEVASVIAMCEKMAPCALSFLNHPLSVVGAGAPPLLTLPAEKALLVSRSLIDELILLPFTRRLSGLAPEEFIRGILAEKLHAREVIVGADFHFGYERKGDAHLLMELQKIYGYEAEIIKKETYNGREISSTYIRELLLDGNVPLANKLLGYPYEITSVVEHGQQLGRTLGFPTMNLAPQEKKILPKYGVYACRVLVDGVWYGGVGNAGVKPTVAQEKRRLFEVYVYGYEGDAYGKTATVQILEFERPETKFHSVEELKDRVMKDMRYGEEYLKNHPFDER